MSAEDLARAAIAESIAVKQAMLEGPQLAVIADLAGAIVEALRAGNKVLFCGNGGSAADATHLAAELVGRYLLERAPLAALSLTDNASCVTAIGNDYGYAETICRQVRGLGRPGDVLVALTTSGTSPNILAAVEAASEMGIRTAGLTGTPGGDLAGLVDICLQVPSGHTARIQEGHMLAGHTVCELVEHALFARSPAASMGSPPD